MENFKKFCKERSITFFFPISLILTIVPLIVRMRISEPGQDTLDLYGPSATSDLFTQNKEIALIFLVISGKFVIGSDIINVPL